MFIAVYLYVTTCKAGTLHAESPMETLAIRAGDYLINICCWFNACAMWQ